MYRVKLHSLERITAVLLKSETGAGAGAGILVNTANSDITNLTKNDVIFCGGSNDVAKKKL